MSLTRAQAYSNIDSFIAKYLPYRAERFGSAEEQFSYSFDTIALHMGIDEAYSMTMTSLIALIATEPSSPFSVSMAGHSGVESFVNALPAQELVGYLYADASPAEQQAAISLIQQGTLSKTSFTVGLSIAQSATSTPPLTAIQEAAAAIQEAGNTELPQPPVFGPFPRLDIPELNDSQQDFLTSIYVGAFGRAPEHEGLVFWAREMVKVLPNTEVNPFSFISEQMYIAGTGNNEGGTHLPHADYIHFAYNNVLGREAEPDGYNFWLNELNSGAVNRGNFIATFIGGVGEGRDATFLDARLAVASYVAQEHVSGRSAPPIDLRGVLNGVVDMPSAAQTIEQLEQISLVGIVLTFDLPI